MVVQHLLFLALYLAVVAAAGAMGLFDVVVSMSVDSARVCLFAASATEWEIEGQRRDGRVRRVDEAGCLLGRKPRLEPVLGQRADGTIGIDGRERVGTPRQ